MLDPTPASQRIGQMPLLQTIGLTKRYGSFAANDAKSGRRRSTHCLAKTAPENPHSSKPSTD
jgi:hypothetical protein